MYKHSLYYCVLERTPFIAAFVNLTEQRVLMYCNKKCKRGQRTVWLWCLFVNCLPQGPPSLLLTHAPRLFYGHIHFNRVNSRLLGAEAGGHPLNARCQLPPELTAVLPPGQMLAKDSVVQTISSKTSLIKRLTKIFYFIFALGCNSTQDQVTDWNK